MRILILNYEFPPLGGGAGVSTRFLAEALTHNGHEVSVLTAAIPDHIHEQHVRVPHVRLLTVPTSRKSIHDAGFRAGFTYVRAARRYLATHADVRNVDIIHTFFSLPTGLIHLLPGAHRSIPYVVSLRGSDVPGYDPFNKPLERAHTILKPITRMIWRRAGRVTVLSESLKAQAQHTDPSQQMTIIPNGIDTSVFYPHPQFAPELPSATRPLRIVCTSRLVERKGIQHLLHALHIIRSSTPFHLTIIGDGHYKDPLVALTNTLALTKHVTFAGALSHTDMAAILRESDLFALPTMAEAFGNVFLEALACGLPIVGSDMGSVPELIGPENGVLVSPTNHAAMADAIKKLAHDPDTRMRMHVTNREDATKRYSWHAVAEQYARVYRSIIDAQQNAQ